MEAATARSILDNIYRNPPPASVDTCPVCTAPIAVGYQTCHACKVHLEAGVPLADRVVPLTWAAFGTQAYSDVSSYKLDASGAGPTDRLRVLVYSTFSRHQDCLTPDAQSTRYAIAHVPSTGGRTGRHPLERVLDVFSSSAPRITPTYLGDAGEQRDLRRKLRPEFWQIEASQLSGVGAVLLFDDSWTTGGHAQSIASVLKTAGLPVAIIPLARVINTNWETNSRYLSAHPPAPFEVDICPVHRLRHS